MSTEQSSDSKKLQLTLQQKLGILFVFFEGQSRRANPMRMVYNTLFDSISGSCTWVTYRLFADDCCWDNDSDCWSSLLYGRIETWTDAFGRNSGFNSSKKEDFGYSLFTHKLGFWICFGCICHLC